MYSIHINEGFHQGYLCNQHPMNIYIVYTHKYYIHITEGFHQRHLVYCSLPIFPSKFVLVKNQRQRLYILDNICSNMYTNQHTDLPTEI